MLDDGIEVDAKCFSIEAQRAVGRLALGLGGRFGGTVVVGFFRHGILLSRGFRASSPHRAVPKSIDTEELLAPRRLSTVLSATDGSRRCLARRRLK
jgi:hypothetical protein